MKHCDLKNWEQVEKEQKAQQLVNCSDMFDPVSAIKAICGSNVGVYWK